MLGMSQTQTISSLQGKTFRVLSLIVVLTMMFALMLGGMKGETAFADEQQPAEEVTTQTVVGSFMLSVVKQDGSYLIEPTAVNYKEGQNVQAALEATDYRFVFSPEGVIDSIEGIQAGSSPFLYTFSNYDNHDFHILSGIDASEITALFMSAHLGFDGLDQGHCDLLDQVFAFSSRTDGAKNYAKAKTAYNAARAGLPTASNEAAQTLADNLESALAEYDAIMQGTTYPVAFTVKQGSTAVTTATVTLTDIYGNKTQAVDGKASLVAGTYTYQVLSQDGSCAVRGSKLVVEPSSQEITVTADLPQGNWFGDLRLFAKGSSGTDQIFHPVTAGSVLQHNLTFAVPDTTKAMADLFVSATASDSLKATDNYRRDYPLRAVYTGTNTTAYDVAVGYESLSFAPPYMVAPGFGTNEVTFEIRHYTDASNTVYQVELCKATLDRSPTLSLISVKDGLLECLSGFFADKTEYAVATASDSLTLSALTPGSAADGYALTVDGVPLAQGSSAVIDVPASAATTPKVVEVKVSLPNGTEKAYRVSITKKTSVTVALNHTNATTVKVFNNAGSEVAASSVTATKTQFQLVPGETYTYVGTSDTYNHVKSTFTAAANTNVTVPKPSENELLKSIGIASDGAYANTYTSTSDDLHEGVWIVPDSYFSTFVKAEAVAANMEYRVSYPSQVDGSPKTVNLTSFSDGEVKGGKGALDHFARKGGYGNQAVLTVMGAVYGGVEYYQSYNITIERTPTLATLGLSSGGNDLVMQQNIDSPDPKYGFDNLVTDYTIGVPVGTSSIDIAYKFQAPLAATDTVAGGYTVSVDGGAPQDYDYTQTFINTVTLDPEQATEDIEIVVNHPDSGPTTYTLTVNQVESMKVNFDITPEHANITLIDNLTGNRILPNNQQDYPLNAGSVYTWYVAASGYVGASGTFTAIDDDAFRRTIPVTLSAAEENETINPDLEAQWPYFRADENNNAAIDDPTPKHPDEAVLYWANQMESFPGNPILADGYLYTYAGTSIFKLDTVTGETLIEKPMVGSSSFAITPLTYAEGMVFVALSNGRVQAFDAQTLESLWVYTSPLGGQPNCPITYYDGCIYTGFHIDGGKTDFAALTITDENPEETQEAKVPLWTYAHKGGFYWAGAYACDDYVLVGSDSGTGESSNIPGTVFSFDPKTGAVLDRLNTFPGDTQIGNIRSAIVYDEQTDRYYFSGRSGYLCSFAMSDDGTIIRDSIKVLRLENDSSTGSVISTTTPVIYNGRAYVSAEVAGYNSPTGQCVDVIDLATNSVAYVVNMAGRIQGSGLLTSAYQVSDGYAYLYFFENAMPGTLRYFKDKPGQTEPISGTVQESGRKIADPLFSPVGSQANYSICSPIADEYGTIYFKNDSRNIMALGSTIESIKVTRNPDRMVYKPNSTFDSRGIVVTATYTNGKTRDISKYVTYSNTNFTSAGNATVTIKFPHTLYQNADSSQGSPYTAPSTSLTITVSNQVVPVIMTSSLEPAHVAASYQKALEVYGSPETYTWNLQGTLPQGVTFNKNTGTLSGTPEAGQDGSYELTFTVSNSSGSTQKKLTLEVYDLPSIQTAYNALPTAQAGVPYTAKIDFRGNPGPVTLSMMDKYAFPAGITLNSLTGEISGTPEEGGVFSVRIRAQNEESKSPYRNFQFTVNEAPGFLTDRIEEGTLNVAYSVSFEATGTPAPTMSLVSGTLPAGVSFNATDATLTGIPSQTGSFTFTLAAQNGVGEPVEKTFTLVINATALRTLVNEAALLNEVDYTPGTWSVFSSALAGAQAVLADGDATPEEYNDAYQALSTAIDALETKADKTALATLVSGLDQYKETEYSTSSWAALLRAKQEAEIVLAGEDSTQTMVDTAYGNLQTAISGLTPALHKGELQALVVQAEALDQAHYSQASWETLQEALTAARSVLNDNNAPVADVENAYQLLSNAYNSLVTVADKTGLRVLVDDAQALLDFEADYTETSWSTFIAALDSAQTVLDDEAAAQDSVDAAYNTLNDAKRALKLPIDFSRLSGKTAADTSVAISQEGFPDGTDVVVLARDDDFADAMSSTGLAGVHDAPILLTNRMNLSQVTANEIKRLGATTVYIIGGKGAIMPQIETDLENFGIQSHYRIAGLRAWDTSVECAKQIQIYGGSTDKAIVSTSHVFQDALSISSFAYKYGIPIFLSTDAGTRPLPQSAIDMIGVQGTSTIYVPGGNGAVARDTVEGVFGEGRVIRMAGKTAYDTSNEVANYMVDNGFLSADVVTIACGALQVKGVDALAGAALAGKSGGVLLLVNANTAMEAANTVTIDGFLTSNVAKTKTAYALGGNYVIPPDFYDRIEQLLAQS